MKSKGIFHWNYSPSPIKVKTMLTKEEDLHLRMQRLKIKDSDLVEKFILGSGSGGQKINKTSSCVYLKHLPTGIEVKCQKSRSRELNRVYARRELCEKLEELLFQEKSKKQQAIEKIRRQKKKTLSKGARKNFSRQKNEIRCKKNEKSRADKLKNSYNLRHYGIQSPLFYERHRSAPQPLSR